ncbi:MAG: hypothetical protein JNL81_14870 [Hyphomonadaceae bacterium]|nr:hypothetical protein [Hyphomonadaceae bacterium]
MLAMHDANYPRLSSYELTKAGQALFGAGWRGVLAKAFEVTESEIVAVESGRVVAPETWRAQLIALAQATALRAMETANTLLSRDAGEEVGQPLYAPQPPGFA